MLPLCLAYQHRASMWKFYIKSRNNSIRRWHVGISYTIQQERKHTVRVIFDMRVVIVCLFYQWWASWTTRILACSLNNSVLMSHEHNQSTMLKFSISSFDEWYTAAALNQHYSLFYQLHHHHTHLQIPTWRFKMFAHKYCSSLCKRVHGEYGGALMLNTTVYRCNKRLQL